MLPSFVASEDTTLTTNLQNASDAANTKNAYKNVITTFLSEIMYVIPKEVVLTSIENPSARKIVINAQSEKYEQLAYFKALLKSSSSPLKLLILANATDAVIANEPSVDDSEDLVKKNINLRFNNITSDFPIQVA